MSTDIHQLRSQNSEGAVIGRKSFVQLGHLSANAGQALHQMDFDPHLGEVQRRLDTRDASSNDKNFPIHECVSFRSLIVRHSIEFKTKVYRSAMSILMSVLL